MLVDQPGHLHRKRKLQQECKKQWTTVARFMLEHFQKVCDTNAFYSLPSAFLSEMPQQPLTDALTSGASFTSRVATQLPSLLPLSDDRKKSKLMAIEDVRPVHQPAETCLVQIHDDDFGHFTSAPAKAFSEFGESTDSSKCPITLFKITIKSPARMKRPLYQSDHVLSGDVAVRLYRIISISEGQRHLKATEARREDISVMQLFTHEGVDTKEILANLKQWCVSKEFSYNLGFCLIFYQSQL